MGMRERPEPHEGVVLMLVAGGERQRLDVEQPAKDMVGAVPGMGAAERVRLDRVDGGAATGAGDQAREGRQADAHSCASTPTRALNSRSSRPDAHHRADSLPETRLAPRRELLHRTPCCSTHVK